jgi:exonuclease SbcC
LVRLLSLQAHNFKRLRLDTAVHFDDGITVIAGLNESGKSSVLDAILYALFGRVIRPPKAKIEDILAYGTNEAIVALEFEAVDRRFKVTRRLHRTRPTRATLEELDPEGSLQQVATGPEKVNEGIVKLLGGITYQEIISSTVMAQKELGKLIELHKDDRRKIVNVFLNLDSFNQVLAQLSEERKDLDGTPTRPGKVAAERQKLDVLSKELDEFRNKAEEKTKTEQHNMALSDQIRICTEKLHEKDQLYNTLTDYGTVFRSRENLTLQLEGKRQLYNDQASRSVRLKKESVGIESELSKFVDYGRLEPSLQKIQEKTEALRAKSIQLSAQEHAWKTAEDEMNRLAQGISYDEPQILKQVEQSQKRILPYGVAAVLLFAAAGLAFLLGNLIMAVALLVIGLVPALVILMRLRATTALVKQQSALGDIRYLNEKRLELTRASNELGALKASFQAEEKELAELCESVPGYDVIFRNEMSAGACQAARAMLEAAGKDREQRDALEVKLQSLRDEIRTLPSEADLAGLGGEIARLEEQLTQLVLPALPSGIAFSQELLSSVSSERNELTNQMAADQIVVEHNLQRIRDLDGYLSEHQDIMTRFRGQEEVVKGLERQLAVTRSAVEGVQATAEALRNRIRPSVQSYMTVILPALTSSRYRAVVLDEDYNLRVWDPEAGEYKPRDFYSGGTEDQFLLGMRLAFALALLPEVKGQKPEFVFLDEPLGSSDEVRRSGIVEYLARDLTRKFKQIFVISHVRGLESYARNVMTLEDGKVVQ